MPFLALGNGLATVKTFHDCTAFTVSRQCSSKVLIGLTGVVRRGDKTLSHGIGAPGCPLHAPALSTASAKVFVEGKGVGRLNDLYGGSEQITNAGQSKVNAS